eukprot:1885355-Amphidinium_carterae.2
MGYDRQKERKPSGRYQNLIEHPLLLVLLGRGCIGPFIGALDLGGCPKPTIGMRASPRAPAFEAPMA